MLSKTNKQSFYQDILEKGAQGEKLLAVLLDPDKIHWDSLSQTLIHISNSPATHIFVGGSHVGDANIDHLVKVIRQTMSLPVIIFPGHPSQISRYADGIMLLSLISGRNPDFLIGYHVTAAPLLKSSAIEVIPTGYLLIDGGSETSVQKVSKTTPIKQNEIAAITDTALAGQLMGSRLIYLEAGSGAAKHVSAEVVKAVRKVIDIPIIVGGGIRSARTIDDLYSAGADMVVIGTAFEEDINFFTKQYG